MSMTEDMLVKFETTEQFKSSQAIHMMVAPNIRINLNRLCKYLLLILIFFYKYYILIDTIEKIIPVF